MGADEIAAVSREDFDLLCEVVELVLAIPGGVADMQRVLSWQGQNVLERFAEMRLNKGPSDGR